MKRFRAMATRTTIAAIAWKAAAGVAAALLLTASDARAGHRAAWHGGWHRAEGYGVVKFGGYGLDHARTGGSDLDSYLGLEMGSAPAPYVQLAFTVDWLRRRNAQSEVYLLDTGFDLPVEGVVQVEGTSTDLVPVGGLLRLRFPVADGRIVPFVAGQLSYDLLRMSYRDGGGFPGPVEERTEYFHGLGTTVSIGAEAVLDPRFGVMVEAGLHDAELTNDLLYGGVPVDARVNAGGEFVRMGLRFGWR
jgi:hypothetical protein